MAWAARRLDEPRVLAALDSMGAPAALSEWSDGELARAAWVLSPARTRAEAEVAAARAGLAAAGDRPSPGIATATEFAFSGRDGSSRWGIALSGLFNIEFGGKRDARRARAEAVWLEAVAAGARDGWQLESRVRVAARRARSADDLAAAGRAIALALDTAVLDARRRAEEGVLGQVELSRLLADQGEVLAEAAAGVRAAAEAQAALALEVGVPPDALDHLAGIRLVPAACPTDARRAALLAGALERRWDLREALAAYQVAEADLRIQVARSWPDLNLGPGLFFDHGVGKWTVDVALPDLILHGNRSGIAEAEARRAVAAAGVHQVEEQVLNEVERALTGCAAALAEQRALDASGMQRRVESVEAAFARGEVGRLESALIRVEEARFEWRRRLLAWNVEMAGAEVARVVADWPPTE